MIREPHFHQFALAELLPFFEQFPTQYLSGERNIKLAYRHLVQPESAVRKLMILVNGRAENMLKWTELAYDFYQQGYAVSCEGLGYEEKAVMLEKNKELSFDFGECPGDSVEVEIRLLPNHPIHGGQLRFSVSIDKKNAQTVSYETQGRSEEWKENVLRNQAIRRVVLPVKKRKKHNLTIKALDEGVVIDQIEMYQLN